MVSAARPIRLALDRHSVRVTDMRIVGQLRELLATAPSGRAFLEKVFHLVSDCNATPMGRSGCLLMNTATEFGQRDPAIARQVNEALGHFEKLFLEAVTRAQAEGLGIPKSKVVTMSVPNLSSCGVPATPMRTMRDTEGTPSAFIANSMYSPGSAMPGLLGTCRL